MIFSMVTDQVNFSCHEILSSTHCSTADNKQTEAKPGGASAYYAT